MPQRTAPTARSIVHRAPPAPPPAATGRLPEGAGKLGEGASKPTPKPAAKPRKVRAIQMGYIYHIRRRIDDVFTLSDPDREFSERWMTDVPGATPEKITTGQEDLRKKHDEILGGSVAGGPSREGRTGDEAVLGE